MSFKVAMLSLHTSPLAFLGRTRDAGGMNVYVRNLARELGASGISVDIFTRQYRPDLPQIQPLDDATRLIHLPAGPATLLPPEQLIPYVTEFSRRVAHVAEQQERSYDMVHSHYWLSAVAGLSLAAEWDTPHVTMYHTVERLKTQQYGAVTGMSRASVIRMEQEARIAAEVDCVTVSTEHEAEQLRRLYGRSLAPTRVIPCGVDLQTFRPVAGEMRAAKRRLLAPDGLPLLLFVGRLDPIKGLDLLLESLAQMRTPARLAVIGGNPDGDAEVERLRQRAQALGIAERVAFSGAVAQPELPSYYAAADALVVTSRYESFGLAAVESLACGTPVVAAQVGGLSSIVRDGENGLLVRWRSAMSFAERLDTLLTDRALAKRLRSAARPSVERFDWGRIGERVRNLYAELSMSSRMIAVGSSC